MVILSTEIVYNNKEKKICNEASRYLIQTGTVQVVGE
jgi:hypothetical protein